VPANALLLAVVVGTLLGTVQAAKAKPAKAPVGPPAGQANGTKRQWPWLGREVVAAAMILATGFCLWEAGHDVVADLSAEPLRQALFLQRLPRVSSSAKRQAVETALAGGLWAAELRPWNAEYAELLGRAYLHLSEGQDPSEMQAAERWFCRTLEIAPLRLHLRRTLDCLHAAMGELELRTPLSSINP
jgi:hypothetical protein